MLPYAHAVHHHFESEVKEGSAFAQTSQSYAASFSQYSSQNQQSQCCSFPKEGRFAACVLQKSVALVFWIYSNTQKALC